SGPKGLAFPSDHTAVQASVVCTVTALDRHRATDATMPKSATTTTVASGPADAATTAAITKSFDDLFGGSVTDVPTKLAALEDATALHDSFMKSLEATKSVASRISVRIDAVTLTDAAHASVTYTLLLDGTTPVLDHLPGGAVYSGARWLVTKR